MKGYRQLKYEDRLILEKMLRAGIKKGEIARRLHIHKNTVTNEIKRGRYLHRNSDYTEEYRYSAELAEERYQENVKMRGTQLKIANDYEYAQYLENRIADDDFSPSAVLGELEATGRDKNYKTKICVTTLYSYIDKGVFLKLTNKDLPVKGKRKRKYHKVKRQKRASAGKSITERPKEVEDRETFGHWEMDTVVGKQEISKNVLLVLTERKTRQEILFKMPTHEAKEVVKKLDFLETVWEDKFPKVFKSITVDNGSEFAYNEEMEKSIFGGKRTKIYYCHAYSSWERGSNENQNKLVRRKIPKGSDFDNKSAEDISNIEHWINHYPRKIFDFHTSAELFDKEVAMIT